MELNEYKEKLDETVKLLKNLADEPHMSIKIRKQAARANLGCIILSLSLKD